MPTLLTPDMECHGGALLVINGKKCNFGSVRGYVAYKNFRYGQNHDPLEAEARELKKPGGRLYWISREDSVLSSDPGFYDREAAKWADAPRLSVGDIVEYEGKLFEIKPAWNDNFSPVAI